MKKRIISFLLMSCILLSMLPISSHSKQNDGSLSMPEKTTIRIGDYISLGKYNDEPIIWRCVDIDENGPLMLSDKIISFKAFDANGENENYHVDSWGYIRKERGSSCWSDSNIRQWLNSSDSTVTYSHCPPTSGSVTANEYADEAGFLFAFSGKDMEAIKTVTQIIPVNAQETKRQGYCDGGTSELADISISDLSEITDYSVYFHQNVTDKIFLLNAGQVVAVEENLPGYLENAYPTKTAATCAGLDPMEATNNTYSFWTVIPNTTGASFENVRTGPSLSAHAKAYDGTVGVRPAFYLNTEVAVEDSGTCGDNLTWTLKNGVLTISGEGVMEDYNENSTPWRNWDSEITTVILRDGVLTIGAEAFAHCFELADVKISESVTTIGAFAFDSSNLTSIEIPEGVITIECNAFRTCENLSNVVIPSSVTQIGSAPFHSNTYIRVADDNQNYASIDGSLFNKEMTQLIKCHPEPKGTYTVPDSVKVIEKEAFAGCSNLHDVKLPDGLVTIEASVFYWCTNLTNMELPDGVTSIGEYAFECCEGLSSLTIPKSVTSIGNDAFLFCTSLTDVYYAGSVEEWNNIDIGFGNQELTDATIHYNYNEEKETSLSVYSDYTSLSISTDSIITLSAGFLTDGECADDVSSITFQVENDSILTVSATGVKNNCRYVKLKGLKEGTTAVAFSDSRTGDTVKIPVTVYDNHYHSYTLSTVPTQHIDKYPTNIYNVNGLFIDSYTYKVNNDLSATVSFDVYNTNYTYGVVEVLDENGKVTDAVLIEKMTSSNTSIKEAVWDNIGYLVRDIIDGDLLSYRQESGYTKKTSVIINIPKNGYIKICTDPKKSLVAGVVNSADILLSMASLADKIKDYDANSKEYTEALSKKLVTDEVYAELIRDGSNVSEELWNNIGEDVLVTTESMGNFADTIAKNINDLNLGSIIADTAWEFGWDIGENVFGDFAGPIGTALDIVFTIGKMENFIIQNNDFINSVDTGSIVIQNQGGGFRASQQIAVKSENAFPDETALNVFEVVPDSTLLDNLEDINPEVHDMITKGLTYTYNITLLNNGVETQPAGEVTVYIPIPKNLKLLAYMGKTKVYRVEENDLLTEMDIKIDDGCFVFTTNHFSLYMLCGFDDEVQNEVCRLSGDNRFLTAIMAADAMKENLGVTKFDAVIVASGTNFADALSGSYLAAVKNAPILLSCNEDFNPNPSLVEKCNTIVLDYIRENLSADGVVYILGGPKAVTPALDAALEGYKVKRLAGANRYETNIRILEEAGVVGKDVLICNGEGFADSLSASATELPILLVNSKYGLFDLQKPFLEGCDGKFYIIGGTSAVNSWVESQLQKYSNSIERIGGKDRFETSVMIAERFFEAPDSAVLAYAWNFPDGLCGGALAATMDAPLILTMDKYEARAAEYIQNKTIKNGFILGGETLISNNAVNTIFAMAE